LRIIQTADRPAQLIVPSPVPGPRPSDNRKHPSPLLSPILFPPPPAVTFLSFPLLLPLFLPLLLPSFPPPHLSSLVARIIHHGLPVAIAPALLARYPSLLPPRLLKNAPSPVWEWPPVASRHSTRAPVPAPTHRVRCRSFRQYTCPPCSPAAVREPACPSTSLPATFKPFFTSSTLANSRRLRLVICVKMKKKLPLHPRHCRSVTQSRFPPPRSPIRSGFPCPRGPINTPCATQIYVPSIPDVGNARNAPEVSRASSSPFRPLQSGLTSGSMFSKTGVAWKIVNVRSAPRHCQISSLSARDGSQPPLFAFPELLIRSQSQILPQRIVISRSPIPTYIPLAR